MMPLSLPDALARLERHEAALVCVVQAEGSVPREVGAWMLVWADAVAGTIGGGQLEFQAIAQARADLAHPSRAQFDRVHRYPLGPSLGQCCGGVVHLRFERVGAADAATLAQRLRPARQPLALFGGGHVGCALVQVLAPLPFAITWVDSRNEIFPSDRPPQVHCEYSDPVQAAVADLAPGSRVLVMSFSHAEDLDIVAACLRRQRERGDLPFVGLIGSQTKWATFRHRLADRGYTDAELAQVTCPIGLAGIRGKQPEVIAVAVAAQLLQLS
jgi:xanthine dehydrogenase accessory factor